MKRLSVIIPTRNRAQALSSALRSIAGQTLSQDEFEVIVVDNGSVDNTRDIFESFRGTIRNLLYSHEERPGLHAGRHRGLSRAGTDILVYADDDIEAFPTWLQGVSEAFEDQDVVLAGGKVIPRFENEPPGWLAGMWERPREGGRILTELSIIDLGDHIREISPYHVFGCNFSIKKQILLDAGGFHPDAMPREQIRFRGDGETSVANYINTRGHRVVYHPRASVYHRVTRERMTEAYFSRRAYCEGISDSYARLRRGRRGSGWKQYRARMEGLMCGLLNDWRTTRFLGSYMQGFHYHQREVRNDVALLEWVMKKDYFS